MKIEGVSFIEAVEAINSKRFTKSLSFGGESVNYNSSETTIKKIEPLKNKVLIDYLLSRGISYRVAYRYIKEMYYTNAKGSFFSLCFKNDKGGYELRNWCEGSKIYISPKWITTIPGELNSVNIFESYWDFLSALEYFGIQKFQNSTIILNSISFVDTVIPMLKAYQEINCTWTMIMPG